MYTYTDLKQAGYILAKPSGKILWEVQSYKDGVLIDDELLIPCSTKECIEWAKSVLSFFTKQAWQYLRRIGCNLKQAYAYIIENAKQLDIIQAARRNNANKRIVIALAGQTGKQLQRGKKPRENFAEFPTMKTHIIKTYASK